MIEQHISIFILVRVDGRERNDYFIAANDNGTIDYSVYRTRPTSRKVRTRPLSAVPKRSQ